MRRPLLVAMVLVLAGGGDAFAHTFGFTDVTLRLQGASFQAEVSCDLDALALGVDAAATDSAALAAQIGALTPDARRQLESQLGQMLQRRLRVLFDDRPAAFTVTLPESGTPRPSTAAPSALGLVARLEGGVPSGARSVRFFASRAFPPVRLRVVATDGRTLSAELLERGDTSAPVTLDRPAPAPRTRDVVARFLHLGFTHILPAGLDHVLFVLSLALLSTRLGPLLAQVSAFTAAHTVSLALAVYGIVSLPSRVVEPLIAASIVYVAVENLLRATPSRARFAVVFVFGLLHGLGFAGALTSLGWPSGRRLAALLAFNAGVELGQIAVIAAAVLLLSAAARLRLPRRRLEQAASAMIACVALVWTVQRLAS